MAHLIAICRDDIIATIRGAVQTEGQCGIVARNIHEFKNIVSVWGGYICDYWNKDVLASSDVFYNMMNDPERLADYDFIERNQKVLSDFTQKYGFAKEIYEMAVSGMTVTPALVVKATTDEFVDSEPLM